MKTYLQSPPPSTQHSSPLTAHHSPLYVAMAPFLLSCPEVLTLGIRASIADYSAQERDLLRRADFVFFPTPRFIDVFRAIEKPTFPSYTTYKLQRSRVLQKALFEYLELPHPRTRIYFGNRQKKRISGDFAFPLLVMGPEVIPAVPAIHVADGPDALSRFAERYNPVLIRSLIEWSQRVRLLCVDGHIVGAHLGSGALSALLPCGFEPVPSDHPSIEVPVEITRRVLMRADVDDIVIEWGLTGCQWQITGMSRPPLLWIALDHAINRHHFISHLIQSGEIRRGASAR